MRKLSAAVGLVLLFAAFLLPAAGATGGMPLPMFMAPGAAATILAEIENDDVQLSDPCRCSRTTWHDGPCGADCDTDWEFMYYKVITKYNCATDEVCSRTRVNLACLMDGSCGGVECPEEGDDPDNDGGGTEL